MLIEDLVLVSIDDHVVEPPNLFDEHVPTRFSSEAPKLVRLADGSEAWEFQGEQVGMLGLNSVVSWPKDEWGLDPTGVAEMRPGAYNVHERVRDMNRNGVLASMCFPTMPGFSGRVFQEAPDHDLSLIMLKAYNDWHIDEWCASYPGRFLPNAIGPIWDASLLAHEVRRVAAKGCSAISMPELPHLQHLPGYGSDYWDPFFAACCDEGVVMNLHIGQGLQAISQAPDSPAVDCMLVVATQVSTLSVQDLLWGPALRKYPALKIAWSEGGIGWVPFMLDRIDRQYRNQTWTGQDFGGKLPSDIFREHALTCFTSDPTSLKLYDEIGIDIIAFETDYPHSDCAWPNAPEELSTQCETAKIPDDGIDKIAWKNACRFYNHDPFAVVGRAQGTVGALRALATDVSVETVSKREWRARYDANPLYKIEDASDVTATPWRT